MKELFLKERGKKKSGSTLAQLLDEKGVKKLKLDTKKGAKILERAFKRGQIRIDNEHNGTLNTALRHRASPEVLALLFKKGAVVSEGWNTILYTALENGASPEALALLFKKGAVVVNEGTFGTLNIALSYRASPEVLELLFEKGAVVSEGICGTLHTALSHGASPEVLELLFEKGAVVVNERAFGTLHTALENGASREVLRLLFKKGRGAIDVDDVDEYIKAMERIHTKPMEEMQRCEASDKLHSPRPQERRFEGKVLRKS